MLDNKRLQSEAEDNASGFDTTASNTITEQASKKEL